MDVVVLGCGPSSAIPTLRCVVRGNCQVCSEAHADLDSKNRRLNPSILIRNRATGQNTLVDCGKTFREGVLRLFPSLGIQFVDAVVLTHGHADACLGLDDLREVQRSDVQVVHDKMVSSAMPVHASPATMEHVTTKFGYLVEKDDPALKSKKSSSNDSFNDPTTPNGSDNDVVAHPRRWVAQLRLCPFAWFTPFVVCGLTIVPLPVWHGVDYTSSAFEFGLEVGKRFVYISDISELHDDTRKHLTDTSHPRIDVLMIDALRTVATHPTHMNLDTALDHVLLLKPKRTLLTGMGHEFDYATTNAFLVEWSTTHGLEVRMAYDGMRIMSESMR